MKVSFCGACREVTGSCILVETDECKFLVDCGLFQDDKSKIKNTYRFPFNPLDIDFVLLTHAHIDHCGRLPKLCREGFCGNIYATPATINLAEQMMMDSAKVFLTDKDISPIYFPSDVEAAMKFFSPISYGKNYSINKNIRIRLSDAGHVIGSAIFEVWIKEKGVEKKLVFSGDLGNRNAPIVKDTEIITGADHVFVESTYGTEKHEDRLVGREKLKEEVLKTIENKGILIIPVFALERAQEMIFELKDLFENGGVRIVSVFLDSPLAVRVTDIYKQYKNLFDDDVARLVGYKKDDLFSFDSFKMARKRGDSLKFDRLSGPKIVMAGSGMCNGGRVLDYLKKELPNSKNRLFLISFQAEGTLGRQLSEGEKNVFIGNAKVKVRASVSQTKAFSSHADFPKILDWVREIKNPLPQNVFVLHGEEDSSVALSQALKDETGLNVVVPTYESYYEL